MTTNYCLALYGFTQRCVLQPVPFGALVLLELVDLLRGGQPRDMPGHVREKQVTRWGMVPVTWETHLSCMLYWKVKMTYFQKPVSVHCFLLSQNPCITFLAWSSNSFMYYFWTCSNESEYTNIQAAIYKTLQAAYQTEASGKRHGIQRVIETTKSRYLADLPP